MGKIYTCIFSVHFHEKYIVQNSSFEQEAQILHNITPTVYSIILTAFTFGLGQDTGMDERTAVFRCMREQSQMM